MGIGVMEDEDSQVESQEVAARSYVRQKAVVSTALRHRARFVDM